MDAITQVVKDIIDLKVESGNIVDDESFEDIFTHYEPLLIRGNVEVLYKYGELMGFADWIRLPYIPDTSSFMPTEEDIKIGGPILYIINCCVRDDKKHKVLWRLVHEIRKKNKNINWVCWHDNNNKLHLLPYIKKENTKGERK